VRRPQGREVAKRTAVLMELDVLVDAELTERCEAFGEEPTCHIKHVFLGSLDIRDLLEQKEIQELEQKVLANEPDPTPQDMEDVL
jgi:glutaredoxin-related protein